MRTTADAKSCTIFFELADIGSDVVFKCAKFADVDGANPVTLEHFLSPKLHDEGIEKKSQPGCTLLESKATS